MSLRFLQDARVWSLFWSFQIRCPLRLVVLRKDSTRVRSLSARAALGRHQQAPSGQLREANGSASDTPVVEPVLTVRQPWASAIFCAGKDVENRPRRTHYRGRLWIHASIHTSRTEADEWAAVHRLWIPPEPLLRGVILGSVDLVDCVEDSSSNWALDGYHHRVLRSPRVLHRPLPHRGRLSFVWRRAPQGKTSRARRDRRSS